MGRFERQVEHFRPNLFDPLAHCFPLTRTKLSITTTSGAVKPLV